MTWCSNSSVFQRAANLFASIEFARTMKDFARVGYVGLQDHGTPAWYRSIWIKPL